MDDGLRTGTQASSPHNNVGRAWTLFNPLGPTPGPEANDGTDIARVGRSMSLQVGQTLSVTLDSPTERNFFRGYTLKLLSGGANTCYAGDNCTTPAFDPDSISTRASVGTFEYFTDGRWSDGSNSTTLTDVDTSDGVQIDISLTGNSYVVKMTSPGNPVYLNSGALSGAGPIDWVSVEYFGTDSDTYPTLKSPARRNGLLHPQHVDQAGSRSRTGQHRAIGPWRNAVGCSWRPATLKHRNNDALKERGRR